MEHLNGEISLYVIGKALRRALIVELFHPWFLWIMPRKSKKHTTVEEEEASTTTAMVPTEAATGSRKKARERAADVKLEPDSLEQRRRDLQRTIQKTVRGNGYVLGG